MVHSDSFQPLCHLPYHMLQMAMSKAPAMLPDSHSSGSAGDPVSVLNKSTWTRLERQGKKTG